MELDSLKELWKDIGVHDTRRESDEQILAMLRKKSQTPLARMKRNLLWELVAVIVLYSLTIWYYITAWQGLYWEISLLLLLVGLGFLVYYYKKNKLLKEMQSVTCQMRPHLEKQLRTLERYVRFYFLSATLLTPFAYFTAGFIIFFKTPPRADAGVAGSDSYTGFIVLGILSTVLSYFLNVWYVNRLYGRHIKKLKELVLQMEEAGDHKKQNL